MKRSTILACAIFVVSMVLVELGAMATVPRLINYQGMLTDGAGTPISGAHDLTFAVYPDSGASAVAIWTETHTGVPVDNGLFNVILGGVVPIPESLFANGDRWIGIAVDAGPEMTPRSQITSVPWALRTAVADSVANVEWSNVSNIPGDIADGDDNTQLTEVDVDAYVSNNGYINAEMDPTVLPTVKDGIDWPEVNGIPADIADGDDNTQLTEADVDAYVGNNGYIDQEIDPTVPATVKDGIDWTEVNGIPPGFADGVDDVGPGDGHSLDAADGNPTDALYVNIDGKVGIGTTLPARVLHVSDVMRLEPRLTPPSSPSEGDMYMDGSTHKLMVYDGSAWQACF